jgi:uncharacterized protein DUF6484
MNVLKQTDEKSVVEAENDAEALHGLVRNRAAGGIEATALSGGIVVGELIGIADEGHTPLVKFPGQPGSAGIAARAIIDVHGAHVGREVLLAFDGADLTKPIVVGILRDGQPWALADRPGNVEVDVDGERMIVSAKQQLVLRCGKASITLTRAGKVLIEGAYVSSRSTGVNRVKGGAVQLN